MADTKLAKVGITVKESWKDDISYEVLDYTLWRVQDGGDGCGYIAKRANIGVVPNSDDSVWIKATQAGQSIYDLAVKYGHFVGTEEEFEAEYQAALQAARDAASETSATNAEIQEAEELRRASEDERADAEAARQESEIAREATESDRQIAENMRQMAETQRGENETTRQSQETARESSETQRQSNESTRQSNETARESAEQERTADFEALKTDMETAIGEADAATAAAVALNNQVAGDESARQQAEQSRVAAETQRQTAETQRGTNEQTRQTQETARQTAEQTRNTQEGTRQTQETARQTAEGNRASAESQRASNETARQTAETARETQATSDHQRAESDHAIAAEDHATLDEKISHKADIDGSYDGMAVGIARNLEGRTDVTDSFFERTTGGDAEVANGTAQLNEVKGKSQVWNQMIDYSSGIVRDGNASKTISDGVITVVPTSNYRDVRSTNIAFNFPVAANHIFYICGEIKINTSAFERLENAYVAYFQIPTTWIKRMDVQANAWIKFNKVMSSGDSTVGPIIGPYDNTALNDGDTVQYRNLRCIDLTLLGIDNLTTVEEVEAWLAENIGEMPYYPYNAGEVLNNKMTGVESIGFNLLDPATGKADIIGAYSDVYGNYYGITGAHGALTFTDKFGNTETVTPDEDGKFLLETAGTLSVADAGEDCAVFLWWDGTQTEYKPYEKNVGALDVTHIYGKLNGEGDYVRVWPTGMPGIGDIKDSLKVVDGQVVAERKVGEVDMGTLNWQDVTQWSQLFFRALISDIKSPASGYLGNVLNARYPVNLGGGDDKTCRVGQGSSFWIRDAAYNDAASLKTSLNGVPLYYELATPAVYTDLIYRDSESFADNTPVTLPVNYKVDNWGIERIAPQNTDEAVVTTKPELTMRYSIDALEELNTHRDEIDDLYDKNEELDQRKPEKYGEYPDMAVGSAKTLAGNDTKVEDFVFKALDCADGIAKLNSARGKSLVWNQQFDTPSPVEFSFDNSEGSSSANRRVFGSNYARARSHKYYVKATITNGTCHGVLFVGNVSNNVVDIRTGPIIIQSSDSDAGTNYAQINEIVPAGQNESYSIQAILIDLTLMFGAGNEPATVAEFEAMFPLPYYDYNAGEIISNKTEEVKVVGFNQWDEEWELGTINTTTGQNANSQNQWRSKNFVQVIPSGTYCFAWPNHSVGDFLWMLFYDENKNVISGLETVVGSRNHSNNAFQVGTNGTIKMPGNAHFIRFYLTTQYLAPYNNDICINLSDPSRNGEYEPYKTNTIELNLPTLTGKLNGEGESVVVFPEGLKSVGSVYDEIVGNKAIKRVGVVDMGTLTWSKYDNGSAQYFASSGAIDDAKAPINNSNLANLLSVKYTSVTAATLAQSVENHGDKLAAITNDKRVRIYDSAYAAGDADTFKTAMNGVLLYYELETPEEYILDAPLPDTFQAYKGGTIKQLPENTSEPVTAPIVMDVTYSLDAVGILTGLPKNYISLESLQAMLNAMQSAGLFTSYTLTWNESQGKYNFTFQANQ